jgi:hypothetical protein
MNTFYVTVDFESKTFEIQADSVEEAKAKVEQLHEEGEVYNDRSWVAFVEDENGKEVA